MAEYRISVDVSSGLTITEIVPIANDMLRLVGLDGIEVNGVDITRWVEGDDPELLPPQPIEKIDIIPG